MVGWLKKYHADCPSCGSLQVRVPWEPSRGAQVRRWMLWVACLWPTLAAWVWLGLHVGSPWPWAGAIVAYAGATGLLLRAVNRARRELRCLDCGNVWR